MGYFCHDAILFIAWSGEDAAKAHAAVVDAIKSVGGNVETLTAPTPEVVNGYSSFAMLPDGSKEGWEDSDIGDRARSAAIKAAHGAVRYLKVVAVAMPEDADPSAVAVEPRTTLEVPDGS